MEIQIEEHLRPLIIHEHTLEKHKMEKKTAKEKKNNFTLRVDE